MNYADTNWLEAVYVTAHPDDAEACARERIVNRFARKHGGKLAVSHVVLLETRNVFSRVRRQAIAFQVKSLASNLLFPGSFH